MSEETLLDTLADALAYYERGSWQTYDRCCRKVFNYLGIEASEQEYHSWKWQILSFLRDFALLDVSYRPDGLLWQCCPTALVEVDFDSYILIARKARLDALELELSQEFERVKIPWTRYSRVPFQHRFIEFAKMPRRSVDGVTRTKSVQIRVTHQAQWRLISSLLPLQHALPFLTEKLNDSFPSLSTIGVEARYDFNSFEWMEERSEVLRNGFFRRPHDTRRPDFLLQEFSVKGTRNAWRVVSEEWGPIISAYLMGIRIPMVYRSKTSELGFPVRLQLPTILRRILILGNFSRPIRELDFAWYAKTKPSIVDRLCEVCPVFLRRTV